MPAKGNLARSIVFGALGLGLAFNFFFMWRVPGLSLSLYFLLIVSVLQIIKYYKYGKLTFRPVEYAYIPVFLVSLVPFLSQNGALSALSVLFTILASTYVTVMSLWEVDVKLFGMLGLFVYPLYHQALQLVYMIKPLREMNADREGRQKSGHSGIVLKVGLGILLAFPLLLCFVILFASADAVFGQMFSSVFAGIADYLSFSRLWELFILGTFTIWWLGYLAAGFYHHQKAEIKLGKISFDPIISAVVSLLLNVLFAVFAVIQFVYLFSGEENIRVLRNTTYSAYARQGFFQLLVVSVLSFGVVYAMRKWGAASLRKSSIALRSSLLIQILLTLVVIFSSFFRMNMYQHAYGFTDIRLFVVAFLICLTILFVYLGIGTVYDKAMKFLGMFTFVLICSAFFVLGMVNPDAYIARANIQGYLNHEFLNKELDTDYLIYGLSSDAYSQLLDVKELDGNREVYCAMSSQWIEEERHRSSLQELNLSRLGNIGRMSQALAPFIKDGRVGDNCWRGAHAGGG